MLKSVVLGLCVPSVVALLTAASGCTVTNATDSPDGSIPVTPTGDSGTSGGDSATPSTGVLGFTPSNLGDLLQTLDLSKVANIDVTPLVTVAGTIAANGGGGGGGGNDKGTDATPTATAAAGGSTGTAGAGGDSSASTVTGTDGAPGDNTNYGAGGGGGGAGWIRINTKTGAAVISGMLSPAATTQCATQGTLAP